jgi:glutaminyl-peptide cyclotransferase
MNEPHRGLWRLLLSVCLGLLLLILPGAAYEAVSDATLKSLPRPNGDFDIYKGAILAPILRTRVPGTPGSTAVLNHFIDFFRTSLPDWSIEFQNSTSKTPVSGNKRVPFVNLIVSRDPPWASVGDVGRLTLVAHYDSKYDPAGFIGAIDSAAPCAMIMHAIRSIDAALTRKWAAMEAAGQTDASLDAFSGIQVMFLDGEEAFKTWTATDSLYGARSLAEEWEQRVNPAMSTFKTPLSSISLFVLLDLLGSKNPRILSYFPTTHWAYQSMATLEKRLRDLKQFRSSPNYHGERAKEPTWLVDASKNERELNAWGGIQDDHIPFLHRGVEILHIIDTPASTGFPAVWHTLNDDGEHLDMDTVEDWSTLITAFAAEWMELEGFFAENDGLPSQVGSAVRSKESSNGAEAAKWKRTASSEKSEL